MQYIDYSLFAAMLQKFDALLTANNFRISYTHCYPSDLPPSYLLVTPFTLSDIRSSLKFFDDSLLILNSRIF